MKVLPGKTSGRLYEPLGKCLVTAETKTHKRWSARDRGGSVDARGVGAVSTRGLHMYEETNRYM